MSELFFTEKFSVPYEKYRLLYCFDNMYGIMRPKKLLEDDCNCLDSSYYNLVYFKPYINSISSEDVLTDVIYMAKAGKTELKANDIVVVKLNGCISGYRYCGLSLIHTRHNINFSRVSSFFDAEKEKYIDNIHQSGLVLNVPDGRLYHMDELDSQRYNVFCIDKEVFDSSDNTGTMSSNYSVYYLKKTGIFNIDPYSKPFVMLNNAMYYFNKSAMRYKNSVLLYNRREMELLWDYKDLKSERLIV